VCEFAKFTPGRAHKKSASRLFISLVNMSTVIRRLRERIAKRSEYQRSEKQAHAKLYADLIEKHIDSLDGIALDELEKTMHSKIGLPLPREVAWATRAIDQLSDRVIALFPPFEQQSMRDWKKSLEEHPVGLATVHVHVPEGTTLPETDLMPLIREELKARDSTAEWGDISCQGSIIKVPIGLPKQGSTADAPIVVAPSEPGRVYVGNLPYDANEDELAALFQEVGSVISVRIAHYMETGKSLGFGFCEYSDARDAKIAIRELNGRDYRGRSLRVDIAHD